MREIKFRAWFTRDETYVKPMAIQNMIHQKVSTASLSVLYNECVFEEFTGLKDKNGVEIYENDILKSSGGNIEVVIYIDGRFEPVCWYDEKTYEVVGNVHQNADLLAADIERMFPDDIGNDIHEFLHGGEK
jgi:hypothetical protein